MHNTFSLLATFFFHSCFLVLQHFHLVYATQNIFPQRLMKSLHFSLMSKNLIASMPLFQYPLQNCNLEIGFLPRLVGLIFYQLDTWGVAPCLGLLASVTKRCRQWINQTWQEFNEKEKGDNGKKIDYFSNRKTNKKIKIKRENYFTKEQGSNLLLL